MNLTIPAVPRTWFGSSDYDTIHTHYLSIPLYTIILSEPFSRHGLQLVPMPKHIGKNQSNNTMIDVGRVISSSYLCTAVYTCTLYTSQKYKHGRLFYRARDRKEPGRPKYIYTYKKISKKAESLQYNAKTFIYPPPPPKPTNNNKKICTKEPISTKTCQYVYCLLEMTKFVCFVMHRNNVFISSRMV